MNAQVTRSKHFTVTAANRTLPLVRAIVADIVTLYREVHDRQTRLAAMKRGRTKSSTRQDDPYREEVEQVQRELDREIERLQGYVHELQELGVELKDPATGLVDFPTQMDGQDAFLCWQPDEKEVGFWHTREDGFAARRPLPASPTDHAV